MLDDALPEGAKVTQLRIVGVGLLVSEAMPWLAASPDGLVLDPDNRPLATVEVKSFPAEVRKGTQAWMQVQGAMALASAALDAPVHWCCVASPGHIQFVPFDEFHWDELLEKLRSFYFETFLPFAGEYVAKRHAEM